MGIFSKVLGTDARYSKYRKTADLALQELIAHSHNIGRDIEKIMSLKGATPDIRICAYLVGYIAVTCEGVGYHHTKVYKSDTIAKAAKDAVDAIGYRGIDMEYVYYKMIPECEKTDKRLVKEDKSTNLVDYIAHQTTFSVPGSVVAQFMKTGNKKEALFHMTTCLDAMMMERPEYDANGHSNHKDYQF